MMNDKSGPQREYRNQERVCRRCNVRLNRYNNSLYCHACELKSIGEAIARREAAVKAASARGGGQPLEQTSFHGNGKIPQPCPAEEIKKFVDSIYGIDSCNQNLHYSEDGLRKQARMVIVFILDADYQWNYEIISKFLGISIKTVGVYVGWMNKNSTRYEAHEARAVAPVIARVRQKFPPPPVNMLSAPDSITIPAGFDSEQAIALVVSLAGTDAEDDTKCRVVNMALAFILRRGYGWGLDNIADRLGVTYAAAGNYVYTFKSDPRNISARKALGLIKKFQETLAALDKS